MKRANKLQRQTLLNSKAIFATLPRVYWTEKSYEIVETNIRRLENAIYAIAQYNMEIHDVVMEI